MWLIFVLIIVGVVFSFQRNNIVLFPTGPQSAPANYSAPTYKTTPPSPGATGAASGKTIPLRVNAAQAISESVSTEYIVLENFDYETKKPVTISGLKLQNRDKVSATISRDEYGNEIALDYNERAIVSTGESPIGKNFKLNKCSGYFNQQNNFSPYIAGSCPAVSDLPQPKTLNNKCVNYIENLSSCSAPNINADTGINNDCAEFVSQHASYSGCVADHKNDSDFDKHEWRIYLKQSGELWGNKHDLIQLFDSLGKLITETSY